MKKIIYGEWILHAIGKRIAYRAAETEKVTLKGDEVDKGSEKNAGWHLLHNRNIKRFNYLKQIYEQNYWSGTGLPHQSKWTIP